MAKKKSKVIKNPEIHNEVPDELDGLKRLKVGQEVFYKTPYIVEKTTVKEINKKDKVAILENQVRVSPGILPNGVLLKVGSTNAGQVVKVWDEETEKEYSRVINKKHSKNILEDLLKRLDNLPSEQIEYVFKKLTKINNQLS